MRPSEAYARHRQEIEALAAAHRAANPRPFGSVLVGSDREDSDLDLLVDPLPDCRGGDLADLKERLVALLGVPVDLMPSDQIPEAWKKYMTEDGRLLPRPIEERCREYMQHIVEAADKIARYIKGMSNDDFHGDDRTGDAVIRNIEVIGEACSRLSKQCPELSALIERHPMLIAPPPVDKGTLQKAKDMRNQLIHGYERVDLGIVWATAGGHVPSLRAALAAILAQETWPPEI